MIGMVLGFLFRKRNTGAISRIITVLICVLLLLLGIEVGGNKTIISHLHTVGMEAVVLALAATLGSVLVVWLFYLFCIKNKE